MARITIPFGVGVREDVDPRVMPEGALKRVENLRLEREGRLVLRRGYTNQSLTTRIGGVVSPSMVASDLVNYAGRLFAMATYTGNTVPEDLYEYAQVQGRTWRPTDDEGEPRLCPITGLRNVGRVPAQSASVTVCDVAAGEGLVCLVWQSGSDTKVHVFDPETDGTYLLKTITGMSSPRVVKADPLLGFRIFGIVGTSILAYRFNPDVDSGLTVAATVVAAGTAISTYDVTAMDDGSMLLAVAKNSVPSVTIVRMNTNAATLQTITGPAVSLLTLAVCKEAARVHLVAVESGDGHVDLYTYLVATGALENTTLNLASGTATARQPGICVTGTQDDLLIMFEDSTRDLFMVRLDPSTHGTFTDRSWQRVRLAGKPRGTGVSEVFGGLFAATSTTETAFVGAVGRARSAASEQLCAVTDRALALSPDALHLPHVCKDVSTGRYFWARLVIDGDGRALPVVSELRIHSTERRQTAVVDNQLYLSGGVVQSFAGRQIVEAGFLNRPLISSAVGSNGAGALTPGSLYEVCATFEWYDEQGRFHTSEPSGVASVSMGGSDDTITVVVSGPLSARCNATNQQFGGAVKVVVWRTLPAPDKQFLRDNTATIVTGNFGQEVTIVLTQSDSSLSDEAQLYTQGASGARSGPNPFLSPQPARYIYPSGDTLTTGGLPQDSQIQEGRPAFPNEPIGWAENLGGFGSAPERVLQVLRLDERRFALTANAIYEHPGEGLDINGVGDLGRPRRLPSPGGLHGGADGWRSICETAIGIFFQLAADSIFLLPRGGGAPVFIGAPVQSTLASYPVITSATYLKTEQLVCFTCNNEDGDDAVIVVYDLSAQQWFVDTESSALLASCEYQGRLVLLRANNAIEFQDTALPPATFITPLIETGTLYPFGKGGQGQIDDIQLYAEFLGACNVVLSLSYDDGLTYPVSLTKAVTSAASLPIKWGPNQMRGDRVRLKFHATDLSGSTAQLAWQFATVDFTARGGSALRNTTQKG
jgi:hypothetical protein